LDRCLVSVGPFYAIGRAGKSAAYLVDSNWPAGQVAGLIVLFKRLEGK
jgi:hypothetical protein